MLAILLMKDGTKLAVEVSDPPPKFVEREFEEFKAAEIDATADDQPIRLQPFTRRFEFQFIDSQHQAIYEEVAG